MCSIGSQRSTSIAASLPINGLGAISTLGGGGGSSLTIARTGGGTLTTGTRPVVVPSPGPIQLGGLF